MTKIVREMILGDVLVIGLQRPIWIHFRRFPSNVNTMQFIRRFEFRIEQEN